MSTIAKSSPITRRACFIGLTATGGLALGLDLGNGLPTIQGAFAQGAPTPGTQVTIWVVIEPDDGVIIRIARSEMGQGSLTGLCQLVAEELGCDWAKVKWEYVTPQQKVAMKRAWGEMSTGGSRAIRTSHEYVRKGGAQARMMLLQAAANEWKVPVSEVSVDKGVIAHAASGRSTTYGHVAAAAAQLEAPADVPLKDPKTWTIAGKPLPRLDTVDKTVGKQTYAIDVVLPGMLCAAIKDTPVNGTKIASVDDAQAKTMPGVKAVLTILDSAVVVVGQTWWQAKTALETVKVTYQDSHNTKLSNAAIDTVLSEALTSDTGVTIGNQAGDAKAAIAASAKTVEATYSLPYIHHATMEPMSATALFTTEKCEVWTSTQNAEDALAATSSASGLPLAQCAVTRYMVGGGFGRKGNSDYVRQAVLIAKQMPGTPIKLIWSREEDMAHGWLRPIGKAKLTAGLDAQGNITGMTFRIAAPSILGSIGRLPPDGSDPSAFQGLQSTGTEGQFGYKIPNLLIDRAMRNNHVHVWFWRGVNSNQNAIWRECFMDEVAKAAGKDPLQLRRELLANAPKNLAVLNAAAESAGYGKPLPDGVFRGIAHMHAYGSYSASVAEISVSDRGRLKVHRIFMAVDSGYVVNPDQVRAQVEGAIAFGLSAALLQSINIKDGAIVESNFDTFEVMRVDEMPKVEVAIVPSGGFWGGIGEPTISVAAPAVLNGIYAATGRMPRSLPLKNQNLRSA